VSPTPADEIRAAADTWRRTHPGDELAHAFAGLLEDHACTWDPDPDAIQTWDARFDRALAVARAINHAPKPAMQIHVHDDPPAIQAAIRDLRRNGPRPYRR
jgi:hypothetical protein